MRTLFISMLLLFVSVTPCLAASCQDVQENVSAAMQERSGRVTESHDTLLPDPESERSSLGGCLDSINSIGDAFSLGVTFPNMDQLVSGMCSQINSLIQQKINEVHNQALNAVNGIGGNNLYKVYGTGGNYVTQITGKIK